MPVIEGVSVGSYSTFLRNIRTSVTVKVEEKVGTTYLEVLFFHGTVSRK